MARQHHLGVAVLVLTLGFGCHRAPSADAAGTQAVSSQSTHAAALPNTASPFKEPALLQGAPDVASIVAKVKPSVVNIMVESRVRAPAMNMESPFDFFFRDQPGKRTPEPFQRRQGQGSGFVIDGSHVVTNAHVVEGATNVRVKLADERELPAKVVGRDRKQDLAVLVIEGARDLPAASMGSSEQLRVGEYVVAIGNPFGLGHTVTMGIVSAKSRTIGAGPYDDFIQTDASINPGNSGGPLFNLRGEIIGINTAINPQGQGIGFAIPVDHLKEVLPQLLAGGQVQRGRLGVVVQPLDATIASTLGLDRPRGALVAEVERGGPADKAGIVPGDVILDIAGNPVGRQSDLPRLVARHAPGSKVALKVLRDKTERTLSASLDALRDETAEDSPGEATGPGESGVGVELEDQPGRGGMVRRVMPGSPADGSLAPGDLIVEVNKKRVTSAREAVREIKALSGKSILLKVEREGRSRYVAISRE